MNRKEKAHRFFQGDNFLIAALIVFIVTMIFGLHKDIIIMRLGVGCAGILVIVWCIYRLGASPN